MLLRRDRACVEVGQGPRIGDPLAFLVTPHANRPGVARLTRCLDAHQSEGLPRWCSSALGALGPGMEADQLDLCPDADFRKCPSAMRAWSGWMTPAVRSSMSTTSCTRARNSLPMNALMSCSLRAASCRPP